jgi:anti-sigma B factor antagonist
MPFSITAPEAESVSRPTQFPCPPLHAEQAIRVAPVGELDIATIPETDQALRRAQAAAPLVVLDLRAVEFFECSAAAVVLAADRRIKGSGGRLLVVRGPAEVDWVFELLGLDRHLELVDWPSADTAASFEGASA